jgi:hypothetical protein
MLPVQKGLLVDDKVIGDIQAKVITLCQQHPSAANSDADLLALYWLTYDGLSKLVDMDTFQKWLRGATPAESVTRARRSCRHLIKTSPEVEKGREAKAASYRNYWAGRNNHRGPLL